MMMMITTMIVKVINWWISPLFTMKSLGLVQPAATWLTPLPLSLYRSILCSQQQWQQHQSQWMATILLVPSAINKQWQPLMTIHSSTLLNTSPWTFLLYSKRYNNLQEACKNSSIHWLHQPVLPYAATMNPTDDEPANTTQCPNDSGPIN